MTNPLPVLIVKPGAISKDDIKRAEQKGFIIVIECEDPASCRFLEPPCTAPLDAKMRAAMQLLRYIMDGNKGVMWHRETLITKWVDALLNESPPDPVERVKS